MVADGTGGIDFEIRLASGISDEFPENDFRGRRAADVAKTDEKDSMRRSGMHGCYGIDIG